MLGICICTAEGHEPDSQWTPGHPHVQRAIVSDIQEASIQETPQGVTFGVCEACARDHRPADGIRRFLALFDRIGRRDGPIVQEFYARHADGLAEAVFLFARPHLASRDFAVVADIPAGAGMIEGGRFGTFSIREVA